MKSIRLIFLFVACGFISNAQDKPAADICSQLNQVINSSIHRFAEIKTSDKESSLTLDGFPQNGYLTLSEKTYVEWGSRDLIFKKKKEMEEAFADFADKLSKCHFDAATLKINHKLATEVEYDAIPSSDPKFKTLKVVLSGGEKSSKKGQFYIYFTVTNEYFETANTESKESLEKKKNEDNAEKQANLEAFKTSLNAIVKAEPDSFKAVLGAMHHEMIGNTYDCTAKLPGTQNAFFREEMGVKTYQAIFYEGFDSVAVENTYKSTLEMIKSSLPDGYAMEDSKTKINKHITTFQKTSGPAAATLKLTETADRKDFYHLVLTIE